jgi:putative toxin-antitoxin system antitoxin component (TIGR02293 family)
VAAKQPLRHSIPTYTAELVRNGLDVSAYEELRNALRVPLNELSTALLIPVRTLRRRLNEGKFPAEESDRLARLSRVMHLAQDVLGNSDSAREWMTTPNPSLGNCVPYKLCTTDTGTVEVERLLHKIEFGVFA